MWKSGGKADTVESTDMQQRTNDPFEKVEADGTFDIKVKTELDVMLKDLQLWCRFEAEKHVIEATWYEKGCQFFEVTGAVLGSGSLATVGRSMINWALTSDSTNTKWSPRVGLLGCAGIATAGILLHIGEGSASLVPTFQKWADEHTKVAFEWNCLKQKVRVSRMDVRRPGKTIDDLSERYINHIIQSTELSQKILVSKKTVQNIKSLCAYDDIISGEEWFLSNWPIPGTGGKTNKDTTTPTP